MKKRIITKQITLVLTENCNLDCIYCYENNKSNKFMPIELAYQILDEELKDFKQYELVYVDLFGGEPFLAFDNIKLIVEYVQKKKISNIKYKTTTNGTLIHGEIQEWLRQNRNIIECGLSLDGTKETHDINRSNSFDKIDYDFFLKYFRQYPIKMTVSPERIHNLARDIIFCHDLGFNVNCNLALGRNWDDDYLTKLLRNELSKLIDYYIENPHIKPCSMLDDEIIQIGLSTQEMATKWCGTGTHMHTYDVVGNKYPCHYFLPNTIGHEKAQKAKDIIFHEKFDLNKLDSKCISCVIREACPTCYGSNFALSGNVYHKDVGMCKQTKIIIQARAYFKALQWDKGLLQLSESEEKMLLKAIMKIQNIF